MSETGWRFYDGAPVKRQMLDLNDCAVIGSGISVGRVQLFLNSILRPRHALLTYIRQHQHS
ncbi:hypothetical protein F441_04389 [Phytophthora nicotianae CJ01A1]|uniref:Uncharacterized protein n=3 Tax=Phytophthora nicotianae TaxID=4792 RepID=W2LNA2_PHYNI|nr:hypothetical protein L915_04300 [Phytophthora nicotianae]ETL98871.1 hypothetical protein L917_04139 [Phytophthora nicotianae]ETO81200.1 hypothetical protein F444_04439 [Phytophthora nicotianae P1976]ETP22245.1 hypothetical protein F441_04389 [Phytophthora nicotianae CJ01A1]